MKLDHGNLTDSLVLWLDKYIENIKIEGYQNGTIELYRRVINNFIDYANDYIDEYDLKDINRLFINGYLSERQKTLSKNTTSTNLRTIKTFFRFISDNNNEGYDFEHIFRKIKIKVPKRQRPHLTDTEVSWLLNTIETEKSKRHSYVTFRNAMIIKVMLYSGARISEAINIKYEDIATSEIDNTFYKILITGKGNKQDYLYIKKNLIEEEFRYIQETIKSGYLFITPHGQPVDRSNMFRMTCRLFKLSGIKKTGVHILRHTLAMRLAARNVDILHIQKIMRHANIQTTMIYAHSTETDSMRALGSIITS